MNKLFVIVSAYLMVLLLFLNIANIQSISLAIILIIVATTILYVGLISCLPTKLRVIINIVFIGLTSFLTFGNIFYFYIKGSFFTISQLTLLDELVGVTDSVTSYWNPILLLFLIVPLIFGVLTHLALKEVDGKIPRNALVLSIVLLGISNIGFYAQDSLLYSTVYSPIDYAQSFGFISFYAREITPFTKVDLDDVEYENKALKTTKNSYSGMFEDKTNVVMITAESFDDIAIDQELTPTLYKMARDGIFFENYYTLSTNTNASEFSILNSVSPPIDNSHIEDFKAEYTSIPDIFNDHGYCTYGFHSNTENYYNRKKLYIETYRFDHGYFAEDMTSEALEGIGMSQLINDAPDQKLFEKSIDLIEQDDCEKNFTYYMSIYGHSAYDIEHRESALQNYEYVKSIYPQNDEYLNTYLAFQMSLDKMLEEMIEYYQSTDQLEDTLFIVVADHYPYALGDPEHQYGEYSQAFVEQSFSGEEFETYNVPFMIYDPNSKLDNNTEYLSNVDILPTLADLFNFEYIYSEGKSAFDDSRPGIIKWLGINKFGMLGEDLVYTGDENQKIGAELETEIENDKEQAAKLYSLFY